MGKRSLKLQFPYSSFKGGKKVSSPKVCQDYLTIYGFPYEKCPNCGSDRYSWLWEESEKKEALRKAKKLFPL
jgi:hypothetical protein